MKRRTQNCFKQLATPRLTKPSPQVATQCWRRKYPTGKGCQRLFCPRKAPLVRPIDVRLTDGLWMRPANVRIDVLANIDHPCPPNLTKCHPRPHNNQTHRGSPSKDEDTYTKLLQAACHASSNKTIASSGNPMLEA